MWTSSTSFLRWVAHSIPRQSDFSFYGGLVVLPELQWCLVKEWWGAGAHNCRPPNYGISVMGLPGTRSVFAYGPGLWVSSNLLLQLVGHIGNSPFICRVWCCISETKPDTIRCCKCNLFFRLLQVMSPADQHRFFFNLDATSRGQRLCPLFLGFSYMAMGQGPNPKRFIFGVCYLNKTNCNPIIKFNNYLNIISGVKTTSY